MACAITFTRQKAEKKRKKETRVMRREFNEKDRSYQLKLTQQSFNAYIRERDKGLPCISCGSTVNKLTAGHYKTVGAHPELRFEETNVHGQCWWNCNRNRSGNIHEFRKGLGVKIGLGAVLWLEGEHEPTNYTLADIIEIKLKYRRKLKELQNG